MVRSKRAVKNLPNAPGKYSCFDATVTANKPAGITTLLYDKAQDYKEKRKSMEKAGTVLARREENQKSVSPKEVNVGFKLDFSWQKAMPLKDANVEPIVETVRLDKSQRRMNKGRSDFMFN